VVSAVSESPRGWSFLVARGRRKGYRTLLAPDFLVRGGAQELLSRASAADSLDPGEMRTVEIDDPHGEPLTVCFRTEQVAPADVGAARDGDRPVALDQHGRPLEMLYGVVAASRLDRPPLAEHLDRARGDALRSYGRFLADEDGFSVDSSRAFALRGARVRGEAPYPASPTAPKKSPPHQARDLRGVARRAAPPHASRPRRASGRAWAQLAPIAVVAAIGSAAFSLLPDHRPATKISVDQISVGPAGRAARCDAETPMRLAAKVHADRPTRITYRWKVGDATIAKGSVHIGERTTRIADVHGLPGSGVVELVVGRTRRVRHYEIACALPVPVPAPPSPPASASPGLPPSTASPAGPVLPPSVGAPARR
jgi:hypothetical protein